VDLELGPLSLVMIIEELFQGKPVTVAERSNACTVFARLEAGTVGSNPTQVMGV
jgi:hypothetical protein